MEIFTFNPNFSNPIYDFEHIINYDKSTLSKGMTLIYFKKINENSEWERKFYFNKIDENTCYLFNNDDTFSEFNSEENKIKYENYIKELKEKQEKEEIERKIKIEKEKFHIIVHSNKPDLCLDKWINNREDFLEVFNKNKENLKSRFEILNEYATGDEILEILKHKIKRYIPITENVVEITYQLLELMEKKGFYDYDINYKAVDFEEGDLITLPFYLLLYSNKFGTKTLYKVISDFKFDLNKPLIEPDYGPLPFHAIDLLPNFEQEFPTFMKLCVEKGYNMNCVELFDTTQEYLTIIDAMYKIGNPELAEKLKELII
jgi:hypothetical protein